MIRHPQASVATAVSIRKQKNVLHIIRSTKASHEFSLDGISEAAFSFTLYAAPMWTQQCGRGSTVSTLLESSDGLYRFPPGKIAYPFGFTVYLAHNGDKLLYSLVCCARMVRATAYGRSFGLSQLMRTPPPHPFTRPPILKTRFSVYLSSFRFWNRENVCL